MNYPERHNHKWAANLFEARRRFDLHQSQAPADASRTIERLFAGDFEARPVFPGLKLLATFWIAEEHEMKERFRVLQEALGDPSPDTRRELVERYSLAYVEDVKFLVRDRGLLPGLELNELQAVQLGPDWPSRLANLKAEAEERVRAGSMPEHALERWFTFCLGSIISYAHSLVSQAVLAGTYVRLNGPRALEDALRGSYEPFGWDINRLFYRDILPRAGIEELSDITELGTYGMLADQEAGTPRQWQEGEGDDAVTIKESYMLTCQLYGIFSTVETWMELPVSSLTPAYCPYCVGHGEKTILLVVPPSQRPTYTQVEGLGYGQERCAFRLKLEPGEDMERVMEAQVRIFGDGSEPDGG